MAHRKNGSKNKCSYGRYKIFPFLMTMGLDFGQPIARMGLPPSERSASGSLLLLVHQGGGLQRTLLDDHGLLLPSLHEWWGVSWHMNNRHSSSGEWFKREKRSTIVYDGQLKKALAPSTHCLALMTPCVRNPEIRTN